MHGKLSTTPVAIAALISCLLKLAKSSPDQQQPWPTIHLSSFSILLYALDPVPTPKNIQFKMGSREYLRLGPGLFLNSVEPSGFSLAFQNEYLGLMEEEVPNKLCCLFEPHHLHTLIPSFWGLSLPIISLDWNRNGITLAQEVAPKQRPKGWFEIERQKDLCLSCSTRGWKFTFWITGPMDW